MQIMKQRCLLIGGSGFIGKHLTRKLIASGRSVTVLGRNIPLEENRVAGGSYIEGNFSNAVLIGKLVARHDEVIHLAYNSRPNTSFDAPMADLMENLPPALQLFEAAARCNVKLLLVSSGGTVYGDAASIPITEDHPTHPISPYGVTKLALEKYATLYAITKGLKVIIVRPSNPYGEGQLPFIGQGFIATALGNAFRGNEITIFGKNGGVRDYIYIEDMVDGIVAVLDKGLLTHSYNIGSGIGISNLQLVDQFRLLFSEFGGEIHVRHMPERPFDVKINVLDCAKLHKLGWAPRVDINDGLRRTFNWLSVHAKHDALS